MFCIILGFQFYFLIQYLYLGYFIRVILDLTQTAIIRQIVKIANKKNVYCFSLHSGYVRRNGCEHASPKSCTLRFGMVVAFMMYVQKGTVSKWRWNCQNFYLQPIFYHFSNSHLNTHF